MALETGISWQTVRKMLKFTLPPGCRRTATESAIQVGTMDWSDRSDLKEDGTLTEEAAEHRQRIWRRLCGGAAIQRRLHYRQGLRAPSTFHCKCQCKNRSPITGRRVGGTFSRIGRPSSDHIHGSQVSSRERGGPNASRFVLRSRATARSENSRTTDQAYLFPQTSAFPAGSREARTRVRVDAERAPRGHTTKHPNQGTRRSAIVGIGGPPISGHRRKTLGPKQVYDRAGPPARHQLCVNPLFPPHLQAVFANYWKLFREGGTNVLFARKSSNNKKSDKDSIKTAVFTLLHSPPAAHGINRTTWRMVDLQKILCEQHQPLCSEVIRRIIKEAGYKWRRARIVLTSKDPDYRTKVEAIKKILSELRPDEAFFSIDEYGPFAVKQKGGIKRVGPGQEYVVPQWQKSKGWMILTAALELSRNQVSAFLFSPKEHRRNGQDGGCFARSVPYL